MNRGPLMRMVHGALAGIDGPATMTVLRMAAHRLGIIDQMVPQKVEQWTPRILAAATWAESALSRHNSLGKSRRSRRRHAFDRVAQ